MRLKGKTALVVGAGSIRPGMGNGKATAILFAREGAEVVAADRNLDAAKETVKLIKSQGGEAVAVQADVTKELDAKNLVAAAISKYGKLDILFNNVGLGHLSGGLDVAIEDWQTIMDTNIKSILLVCKYAVPEMIKNGGGAIVNNASTAAFHAHVAYLYSTSKAGVVALTKCLAADLGKHNIRVNCVAPGIMDTPFNATIMQGERIRAFLQRIPLKRYGKAEDVAQTVLFLVSPEASYVHGQTIAVDGGLSAL